MHGQEHRRPAQRQGRHLGLVPGRLRADHAGRRRHATRCAAPRTPTSAAPRSSTTARTTTRSSTTSRRPTRTTCRRRSVAEIGHTDQANHKYDLTDFDAALKADNLPAVSFLKAAEYQDGHAGYSDPIDEQHFLVNEINAIQKSPEWKDTAVVIAYDDSDGWYDHVDAADRQRLRATPRSTTAGDCAAAAAGRRRLPGPLRPRPAAAAAGDLAVRARPTTSTTRRPSRPRSCSSSRTTGGPAGSVTPRSTHAPARLTGMFDFRQHPNNKKLILDPKTGAVVSNH